MLFLVQGSIFLKGQITIFPSVSALGKLLLLVIRHVVYVAWTQVMVVYYTDAQSSITMLLIWIEVCPCVRSMEDLNHLVPNQRSIGDERVGEWTDIFRVSYKHRMHTENLSSIDHLLIMCEVLASITAVRRITCANWSYQNIPQPVTEGLYIYFELYSKVIFHRFQGLGTFTWINGRYNFRLLWASSMSRW